MIYNIEYTIEKGDKFMCIKDYIMDDGLIAYTNGEIYFSNQPNCITDDQEDELHDMGGQNDFFEHFILL